MVTLAKYFHDSTGIDLTLKPHRQNTADIDEASARQARSGRERQLVPTALEALYDVVVGLDRVRNYGFDRNSSVPVRLNDRELNHVVDVAQKLKMKYRESDAQYRYLGTIETMAGSYRDMLLGRRDGVSRREGRHGTRHSLIHVGNGTVYEMTNSMQETEIERFRRKTNMRIPAVEGAAPNPASSTADAKGRKVVLGKGAFGIARIARNIVTDEYVAVKKTHPVVDKRSERLKFDAAQPSNFPLLPEAKKAALRAISDAVILPSHEVRTLSKAETGIPRKITNIKEAPPKEIERAESIYTFSELGISTIDDVNKILNFADIHFAGKTASDPLSVAAIKILTDYAKLNGLIGPGSTPQEQLEYGMAIFNHPSFPFKDKHQNQKFRNTLARQALRALAKLHGAQVTHSDIKPQNIVLSQSSSNIVIAKIIDIDMIKDKLELEGLPDGWTPFYSPPELIEHQKYGLSKYDAVKGDAYAIGVSLREILGHSKEDIEVVSSQQFLKAELSELNRIPAARRGPLVCKRISNLELEIALISMVSLNCVRSREEIREPTSVKDISDLLIQGPLGKRITAREAFDLDFFKNKANFLSEKDFSEAAKLIVRFCQFVPK